MASKIRRRVEGEGVISLDRKGDRATTFDDAATTAVGNF